MSSSNTTSSSLPSINATKVVPQNKHKTTIEKTNYQKFKSKTDLNKLRKSKPFRELGDALDYFSD